MWRLCPLLHGRGRLQPAGEYHGCTCNQGQNGKILRPRPEPLRQRTRSRGQGQGHKNLASMPLAGTILGAIVLSVYWVRPPKWSYVVATSSTGPCIAPLHFDLESSKLKVNGAKMVRNRFCHKMVRFTSGQNVPVRSFYHRCILKV